MKLHSSTCCTCQEAEVRNALRILFMFRAAVAQRVRRRACSHFDHRLQNVSVIFLPHTPTGLCHTVSHVYKYEHNTYKMKKVLNLFQYCLAGLSFIINVYHVEYSLLVREGSIYVLRCRLFLFVVVHRWCLFTACRVCCRSDGAAHRHRAAV